MDSYQSLNETRARKWNENEALVSLSPLMWSCWWKSCNACVLYNCVMCASWSNFFLFFAYFRTKVRLECIQNVPILLERPLRAQNKKKAIRIFGLIVWYEIKRIKMKKVQYSLMSSNCFSYLTAVKIGSYGVMFISL